MCCTQLNAERRRGFYELAFPSVSTTKEASVQIRLTKTFKRSVKSQTNLQLSTQQEDMQSAVDTQKEARARLWN